LSCVDCCPPVISPKLFGWVVVTPFELLPLLLSELLVLLVGPISEAVGEACSCVAVPDRGEDDGTTTVEGDGTGEGEETTIGEGVATGGADGTGGAEGIELVVVVIGGADGTGGGDGISSAKTVVGISEESSKLPTVSAMKTFLAR
jgi:hypothetical protein